MQMLPAALAPLGAWRQFVPWIAVPSTKRPGKMEKLPLDWRTGQVHDAHDPAIWTNFETAAYLGAEYDRGHGGGGGFVFTERDPFFFGDIDGALSGGVWSPIAQDLCARFAGCAVEVSQSGTGLHILGQYAGAAPPHACKNTAYNLELYTANRFVALTGRNVIGHAGHEATQALYGAINAYFPPAAAAQATDWSEGPVAEWSGPTDDAELIRRALASGQRSANVVFGDAVSFADLWQGNADALSRKWPDERGFDRSSADQALANHLAFWTGKDCARMERLMRQSALVRDKWDVHRTYLSDTIKKACAYTTNVASSPAPVATPLEVATTAQAMSRELRDPLTEYMPAVSQLGHFSDCVFIRKSSLIWSTGHGETFSRSNFDVEYGGHLFVLDPSGQKTTDSAWEAFTKSRVNKPVIAADECFRPAEEPGALVRIGPRLLVNTYIPYEAPSSPGDISRLEFLLERQLPVERDRQLLISYFASMLQNPGIKFEWWPVLQGVQGNGKTTWLEILQYAVGEHYTHLPEPETMMKTQMQFNDWAYRKLFIGLEEVKVDDRRGFLNRFKTVVTGKRTSMEGKGKDQVMRDNAANGLILSNYRNGLPIDDNERRYAIFFCAQQREPDLMATGLTPEFFSDLHDWLNGREAYAGQRPGFEAAIHWLKTYPLEASMDPARGLRARAPKTSSTDEAVRVSLGQAEQEIIEAVEQGRPGFCGGWVSSIALDRLLDDLRARVPRQNRRELMQRLGYDWHPLLREGRVNNVVTPDQGKPKLYVRNGHLALNATQVAEVQRLYSKAQEAGASDMVQAVFDAPVKVS